MSSIPLSSYPIEPLGPEHDRAAFSCGVALLDTFLRERIGQFAQRRLARPFVMIDPLSDSEKKTIAGYYTLSSQGLDYEEMPSDLRRKLPKKIRVGVTLIGYLAIDQRYQSRGLGKLLLYDALHRALQAGHVIGHVFFPGSWPSRLSTLDSTNTERRRCIVKNPYDFLGCTRCHISLESKRATWIGKMAKLAVCLENYHGQRQANR